MLPSVGYFKSIICPFLENDSCERPYCQFRHDLLFKQQKNEAPKKIPVTSQGTPGPSSQSTVNSGGENSKSLAIEQIVSEAVKRVLKENGDLLGNVDAAKIMELVGQQKIVQKVVENMSPLQNTATKPQDDCSSQNQSTKTKGHKVYSIPAGVPAYTPTPLAVLKKSKPSGSQKVENYVPSTSKTSSSASYEPSKVTARQSEPYSPSVNPRTANITHYDYKPTVRNENNVIRDCYTPPSNTNCDVDYHPTNRELSSTEPSYSPSCTTPGSGIDYSPSSISMLKSEPTYSPAPKAGTIQVDYTPSSCTLSTESASDSMLSPERYLAMLEADKEDKPATKETSAKRSSSSKSKHKDREREKEKERDRDRDKNREKDRVKDKTRRSSRDEKDSKSRHRDREKKERDDHRRREKEREEEKSSKRKERSSDSSPSKSRVPATYPMEAEDSESDVDEECYRIFQEYQPTSQVNGASDEKKRKSEDITPSPSEAIIPLKKQRIAHVASTESTPIPASRTASLPKPPSKLSPSMVMIDRFKKLQAASAASAARASSSLTLPSTSSDKKRIAHVPNVAGLLTSKARLPATANSNKTATPVPSLANKASIFGRPAASSATSNPSTPRKPTLPRPVIAVEFGCKVPANVRQRYLNMFVDEMLKMYDRDEDAFERAVTEEKQCYTRSSNKTVYLNVVANTVNRLRREAESAGIKSVSNESTSSSNNDRKVVSHSAVIAGKGGATVSWSIEKPRSLKSVDSSFLSGTSLYKLLERYVMTMEQQELNGYPRPDPNEKGRAMISNANRFRTKPNLNLSADQRLCDRCGTVYRVDARGLTIKSDEVCTYHWGRPFQRRGEKRYSCCQGDNSSGGCSIGNYHVSDTLSPENMKGFVSTLSKSPPPDGNYGVYALDCEMCYTTDGPELTRVTVIGSDHQTVYEALVKPDNPILDHNTRFSGITEEDLLNVRTTIRDVQAVLLSKFSDKTILIGHSFDSDLRALRMIHNTVIDTSLVFPHSKGPPFKKALRTLCCEILQKIIQNDVGGHDSAEDAVACLDLMIWKVKQDLKLLK